MKLTIILSVIATLIALTALILSLMQFLDSSENTRFSQTDRKLEVSENRLIFVRNQSLVQGLDSLANELNKVDATLLKGRAAWRTGDYPLADSAAREASDELDQVARLLIPAVYDEGGNLGLIIGIIIVALVVGGGIGFFAIRGKKTGFTIVKRPPATELNPLHPNQL